MVKTSTGRRSSQRSWVWARGVGATSSIDQLSAGRFELAGGPLAEPIAVGQAERRTDLEAEAAEGHLRLQEIALDVGSGVPPDVVLRHGIAQDPDRNRTGHRITGPALDEFPAVEVRQLEVDEDKGWHPVAHKGIRLRSVAGVLEGNSVAAKL